MFNTIKENEDRTRNIYRSASMYEASSGKLIYSDVMGIHNG